MKSDMRSGSAVILLLLLINVYFIAKVFNLVLQLM